MDFQEVVDEKKLTIFGYLGGGVGVHGEIKKSIQGFNIKKIDFLNIAGIIFSWKTLLNTFIMA